MTTLPQPDPGLAQLADVVPSALAAMGAAGFDDRLGLRSGVVGACVLLI
ncbi:MAG TPA: alkaline phosphatase family protein, partial [Mycobacterium sp.]|nr:alkaline phosphatase family protein [Mycobacterium sp.]